MANPVLVNGVGSGQSIFRSSSSQTHTLGTKGVLGERVFYYAKAPSGSAITRGLLHVAADIVANHQNLATATNSLVSGSRVALDVTLGATAATASQYADGYLVVTDAGGEGQTFRVKDHGAIASAGTGDFDLYDEIETASDASTTVSLFKNLFDSPQVSNVDQADTVVGVPVATIAAGEYGWVQTSGPCAVLFDEAVAGIGDQLTIGSLTAGSVEAADAANEPIVGYTLSAGVDTEYQLVDLRIRA